MMNFILSKFIDLLTWVSFLVFGWMIAIGCYTQICFYGIYEMVPQCTRNIPATSNTPSLLQLLLVHLQQTTPLCSQQLHTFFHHKIHSEISNMRKHSVSHLLYFPLCFTGRMSEIITLSTSWRSLLSVLPLQTSQWLLAPLLRAVMSWINVACAQLMGLIFNALNLATLQTKM